MERSHQPFKPCEIDQTPSDQRPTEGLVTRLGLPQEWEKNAIAGVLASMESIEYLTLNAGMDTLLSKFHCPDGVYKIYIKCFIGIALPPSVELSGSEP